jgi:hypothetical protein
MKHALAVIALLTGIIPAQAITVHKSHNTLIIGDEIKTGDFYLLRDALDSNKGITTIELNSGGGSISAAVPLARLIRDRKLDTIVGKKDGCFSACTALFLAGNHRTYVAAKIIDNTSDFGLGFHGSSEEEDVVFTDKGVKFNKVIDSPTGYGDMNSLYTELGFPHAVDLMYKAPWWDMHILSEQEAIDNGFISK